MMHTIIVHHYSGSIEFMQFSLGLSSKRKDSDIVGSVCVVVGGGWRRVDGYKLTSLLIATQQ